MSTRSRRLTVAEVEEIVFSDDEENDSEVEDLLEGSFSYSSSDSEPADLSEFHENRDEDADPAYVSKDKLEWKPTPFPAHLFGRRSTRNVINLTPGVTTYAASRVNDIVSAFKIFFPPVIVRKIIDNTNIYGQRNVPEWRDIDADMLFAYFGVLILAGVYKSKNESIRSLFDSDHGRPLFRAIMPLNTYLKVSRAIRFDNFNTRSERRELDKFAPIREIWDIWCDILPKCYNPHEHVTIDEQLVSFRGRCPFRQYMPSKPAKYGLKFWIAADSNKFYVWKIQPYLGKQPGSAPEKNQGTRVVLDLVDGLKGHNITVDNFFTSYELGQKLLERSLTLVGTMRKNKSSIPPKLLLYKNLPLYSSTFAFRADTTLVSYIGRKNKCTILQSTLHSTGSVDPNDPKKLPEIIKFYNATKGGVDSVDKMLSGYSSKRGTNRWPMVVFCNMLDISAYNAYVIFQEVHPTKADHQTDNRRHFLQELGWGLAQDYVKKRTSLPKTPASREIVSRLQSSVPGTSQSATSDVSLSSTELGKRGRCKYCYDELRTMPKSVRKDTNKTTLKCTKCNNFVCKNIHAVTICVNCNKNI